MEVKSYIKHILQVNIVMIVDKDSEITFMTRIRNYQGYGVEEDQFEVINL